MGMEEGIGGIYIYTRVMIPSLIYLIPGRDGNYGIDLNVELA